MTQLQNKLKLGKLLTLALLILGVGFCGQLNAIEMSITVDDLPIHGPLPAGVSRLQIAEKYIRVLKKHHVPEVYGFINAEHLATNPDSIEVLNAWMNAGYPLGNHTYSHEGLVSFSVSRFFTDVSKDETALERLIPNYSTSSDKLFRYPYLGEGETLEKRVAVRKYLNQHSYKIAEVTVDFGDWAWNGPYPRCLAKRQTEDLQWMKDSYLKNADDRLRRSVEFAKTLFGRDIKHILLLHIGAFDADILDQLLSLYESMGVKFISLHEAMSDKAYNLDPNVASEGGLTFLSLLMKSRGIKITPYRDFPGKKLSRLCK